MLLIEGPDLIGKTTLCDALWEKHRELFDGRDKFGLAERSDMIGALRSRVKPRVLCDRSWVSEVVYSLALRRPACVSQDDLLEAQQLFSEAGGLLVVVHATREIYSVILKLRWRPEEAFTPAQCAAANAIYEPGVLGKTAVTGLWCPDVNYSVEIGSPDHYPSANKDIVDGIAAAYREVQRQRNPTRPLRLAQP